MAVCWPSGVIKALQIDASGSGSSRKNVHALPERDVSIYKALAPVHTIFILVHCKVASLKQENKSWFYFR